jgi:hypothetical protein
MSGPKSDHKLIFLPEKLVDRLNKSAINKGVSITNLAEEALERALEAEKLGCTLSETLETYRILQTQLGSGAIQIPRTQLDSFLKQCMINEKNEVMKAWKEAGRWYGEYLRAIYNDETIVNLEKILQLTWNLDEVRVQSDGFKAEIWLVSFVNSLELTTLLNNFVSGILGTFGYELEHSENMRGLSNLSFKRKLTK